MPIPLHDAKPLTDLIVNISKETSMQREAQAQAQVTVRKDGAVADIAMHVAALLVVGGFWYAGAYFTNVSITAILRWFGATVALDGWLFLVFPLIFSVVEIYGWERRKELKASLIFVAGFVAVLDAGTTVHGVATTVAGKTLPWMSGVTVDSGATALGIGVGTALIITFVPERVLLASIAAIRSAMGALSK